MLSNLLFRNSSLALLKYISSNNCKIYQFFLILWFHFLSDDHSRVILRRNVGTSDDYINANYISVCATSVYVEIYTIISSGNNDMV